MVETHLLIIGLGLVMGSFLNVCIYRIPQKRSIVHEGSSCPHCRRTIRPWENIPVLSFLILRGRCRSCEIGISWFYPTVELATPLLFYLLLLKFGMSSPLLVNMVFFGLLIVLIFIDLFERILPNMVTLGGLVLGFLVSPLQSNEFFKLPQIFVGEPAPWTHYIYSMAGIMVGGGFFWLVAVFYRKVRKQEGMGFGDIKMIAMVGAFLGWQYTWLTILVGSFLGAMVGSVYIYAFGRGRQYELPFGSFLGVGAIVSTLWGEDLLRLYLG